MINSIRKFSETPYAKVLLGIIILPFVMWGMGDVFRGGKKNTIAEIDNKKISTQNFVNYINQNLKQEKLNDDVFDSMLSSFIAINLVALESAKLKIKITDSSLAKIIRNSNTFFKNDVFSRTEYEKFLITNNLTAAQFEQNLREVESKKQLFDFISGGIKSPKFLIDKVYDFNNQIRTILTINLENIYKKEFNFTDEEINNYYEKNKENFSEIFRSVKFSNITPNLITGDDEYNNSFFQRLDKIDDAIASGTNLDEILKKFNLSINTSELFNENGKSLNGETINDFKNDLIKKIFQIETLNKPLLINHQDKYLLVQLDKEEKIFQKVNDSQVKNKILLSLKQSKILNINRDLIKKILQNKFTQADFDNLARKNNIKIDEIKLKGINDNQKFNKELIANIYKLPEKKMYIFSESNLSQNLLVYVKNIEHVTLDKKSSEYKKYLLQANNEIINNIYKTYDSYITKKYKVNVNYKSVERVKNYFR